MNDELERSVRAIQSELDALRATLPEAIEEETAETFANLSARLKRTLKQVADDSREAAERVDRSVKEHPWESVAAAGAIGLVVGAILTAALSRSKE